MSESFERRPQGAEGFVLEQWLDRHAPSGRWTPTLTGVANVAASTAYSCMYIKVGNMIQCGGQVDIDPTAAGPTDTRLRMSPPIMSDFGALEDAAGTITAPLVASLCGSIYADITNNELLIELQATDAGNRAYFFNVIYHLIAR